jgi:hypothetical protein
MMPKRVVPFGRRQMRRIDQLLGLPFSAKRPGVIAMLHVGRCGSTVLANLLAQHPNIYWDGKLHRKAYMLYGNAVRDLEISDWTCRQFSISGGRYYGFEFKILDDQYPAILGTTTRDFLRDCDTMGVSHYILLVRRNTLRHVVSHYASRNRGSWHASAPGSVKQRDFNLDVSDITTGSAPGRPLLDYLQEVDDAHEAVRAQLQGQNLLEIEYESDINDRGAQYAFEKTCGFLDVPAAHAEVKNVKVNPFPLRDVLRNYDEVAALLSGTKFSWMLKE